MLNIRASGPRDDATRGTILFVHGFPFDGSVWEPQLGDLPDGWRGLAPDLRGFGRSRLQDRRERGRPSDPLGEEALRLPTGRKLGGGVARSDEPVLTMDRHAEDLAELIEDEVGAGAAGAPGGAGARGGDGAVVCGLSMGGYVALALARRRPDLVRALILTDTRAGPDSDEARENRARMAQTVRDGGAEPIATAMIPSLLGEATRADGAEVAEHVRRMILGTPAETLIAALAGMAVRPDSTALLPSMDVPTLVVVGEDDAITPPDQARAMAEALPDARLAVIPGAGHLPNLERPTEFNRALREFLARLD